MPPSTEALDAVSAIDDDRILRAYRNLIAATLRTNAFAPAAEPKRWRSSSTAT